MNFLPLLWRCCWPFCCPAVRGKKARQDRGDRRGLKGQQDLRGRRVSTELPAILQYEP
jgi:hypothetical protein